MQTFNRVCIKDHEVKDSRGSLFCVNRGKEYITSAVDENKTVMVFSNYWVRVPVDIFAGEIEFTKA